MLPVLPEVIEAYCIRYKEEENEILSDKSAGLFTSFISLGAIIGPLIGGFLNDLIEYRYTCDTFSIFMTSFTVLYFLLNVKIKMLKCKKKEK
jgi:MFS family permease